MRVTWLTNTNPSLPAMTIFTTDLDGKINRETQREADDKVIGRPQATARYTVEELEAKGLVGVYRVEEGTEDKP